MRLGNSSLLSAAPLTLVFLGVNVLLFIVSSMNSHNVMMMDTLVLSKLGASQRELLWDGEWLRLVAPMFLHGGLIHILMNMHFLYRAGPETEAYFGSSNYGTIYLLSGVCGICLSQIFGGMISIGASTSLCGIMGAHLAVKVLSAPVLKYAWRDSEVRAAAFNLGFLLLIGILGAFRMDNWGHFGGMLGGFFIGGGLELWRRRKPFGMTATLASLLFVAVLIVSARWTVFNPTYHIFNAARATEELHNSMTADDEWEQARKWGETWKPLHFFGVLNAAEVDNIAAAYKRGNWNYTSARQPAAMLLICQYFKSGRFDEMLTDE